MCHTINAKGDKKLVLYLTSFTSILVLACVFLLVLFYKFFTVSVDHGPPE
jgi:O-antigen/teichoic acid export membrane protein